MKSKKRKQGYTLVEVLVTMAIFSLVVFAVTDVYVKGIKHNKRLSNKISSFRGPAVALDRISREIMCDADMILYPLYDDLLSGSDSIVFSTLEKEPKIIGYIYDADSLTIKRIVYSCAIADFDPYDLETNLQFVQPDGVRIFAGGIKNINYRLTSDLLLQISLTAQGDDRDYLFSTAVCFGK
ncbi:MAG: type II secretion system protein [Armatimonadota bacterium]